MSARRELQRVCGRRASQVSNASSSLRIALSTSRSLSEAAKLNAVVVAVNWRLTPPEIAYTINDADAKVLIVGPDFLDSATTLKESLTTVTQIVAIGEHPILQSYESWLGPTGNP